MVLVGRWVVVLSPLECGYRDLYLDIARINVIGLAFDHWHWVFVSHTRCYDPEFGLQRMQTAIARFEILVSVRSCFLPSSAQLIAP
jgi:hypothetical protein